MCRSVVLLVLLGGTSADDASGLVHSLASVRDADGVQELFESTVEETAESFNRSWAHREAGESGAESQTEKRAASALVRGVSRLFSHGDSESQSTREAPRSKSTTARPSMSSDVHGASADLITAVSEAAKASVKAVHKQLRDVHAQKY